MQSRLAISEAQCLGSFCLCVGSVAFVVPSVAQVTGDAAEMDRLRVKAEEAIGRDDPDGATMNMGRAALMAKLVPSDPWRVLFQWKREPT